MILFFPAYVAISALKPYSTFDTRLSKTITLVGNWLLAGTAGFVLFTVLGVSLRVKWLGF